MFLCLIVRLTLCFDLMVVLGLFVDLLFCCVSVGLRFYDLLVGLLCWCLWGWFGFLFCLVCLVLGWFRIVLVCY